ncbi:PaaI family thioesterase [Haloechinothrix halophila]|uniref:PaaI family thioesterase n=1 Tax=Haloechinothrix halophila TaxID=1069073 RepID=UPI00040EAB9A|nr:PaaI family thioesterase [Haloechinothrix halophila]
MSDAGETTSDATSTEATGTPVSEPELAAFNELLTTHIPAAGRMGVRAVELRRGYARTELPLEGNGNHIGMLYAGCLFTAAEVLGGALHFSSFDLASCYPVVKDLAIRFLRPARTAVTASVSLPEERITELQAICDAEGKAEFTLETDILDADGTVVAATTGTYQIRQHGR